MANKKIEGVAISSPSLKLAKSNRASKKGVTKNFRIVGIGSSAGGLEALEQFFSHMPADSGLAFVLVSHLSPDHVSMLTEILQRITTMPVVEVQDQMQVCVNSVYTIPPNRDMAIFNGRLLLSTPNEPHAQRLPIDQFFRSLAQDQGNNAIGIILSGTGSDGTLGLRDILDAGGVSLVQDPTTAKFDGMASSAIKAGYASYILPVGKMAEVMTNGSDTETQPLTTHLNNNLFKAQSQQNVLQKKNLNSPYLQKKLVPAPITDSDMAHILVLLRTITGQDFSLYKKSTIGRRIERRMLQHDIESTELYVQYIKKNPAEARILFKELLINVTNFFRDTEAFTILQKEILPQLCKDKFDDYVFRVWVAGCATGEEAYSIAILLRELKDETHQEFKVQIYSTDLDEDAITIARAGIYSNNIVQDVSPERLRRFFVKEETGYRIKKEIREMVVFAVHNVIKDPPFTKLDLLTCRNLMIYLEGELQNRLIPVFHYALKKDGTLFLSPSESIGNFTELFTPINRKWKFYVATHTVSSTHTVMTTPLAWVKGSRSRVLEENMTQNKDIDFKEPNFGEMTRRLLVQYFAPASVITNLKGDILYVHGETGKYLRPAPGEASLNVVEMAREGLERELSSAIHMVTSQNTPTISREMQVKTNGGFTTVALSVRSLPSSENKLENGLTGSKSNSSLLLISFEDVVTPTTNPKHKKTAKPAEKGRIEELELELVFTKESLQATIMEQQAFNEELKSTNEELQSTNEELQSTNEELETSKEELQSVNEELITVNAELQSKIEQLAGMQNDMKNLHDSINIGTVFLDQHMNIRRFTRDATKVYRLVQSDLGRPLADIKSDLIFDPKSDPKSDIKVEEDLLNEAHKVLETLVSFEREVLTSNGTCYLLRIQPYRTLDNVIEGVVLTFTDISQRIKAEVAVQHALELSESIVDTIREPLLVLDANLQIVSANRAFCEYFHVSAADTKGRKIYDLGNRQWNIAALRELLETILPRDQTFEGYLVEHNFPIIGHRKIMLNARCIAGKVEQPSLILLAMEQVESGSNEVKL